MIKPNFTVNDISEYIDLAFAQNEQAIINAYKYVGEEFVRKARLKTSEDGGFRDITGNLRSSIGYIILKDGASVSQSFEPSTRGSDKATGLSKAKAYAKELADGFPKGITLIVVAGMEYAAAVESKGKDVITGSSFNVENDLKKLLTSI
jgi:hypothetical protein